MFDAIRRMFSKNVGISLSPSDSETPERPIETYFLSELQDCKYIKPEYHAVVLRHLKHEVSLTKTGSNLTSDEKKLRGLNPRLAITKELVDVLSDDGLSLNNPKLILEEIYNKATITKARTDEFQKAVRLGVSKFTLNACVDGSECAWCTEHSGRQFGRDVIQQMEANCKCAPYSKCFITPVIDL
jgi:hypothetical protein